MTPGDALSVFGEGLFLVVIIVCVAVLPSLVVGLIVSVFQAATQINEQTLSFIPKLVGMFIVLIIAGPWMVGMMVDFIQRLFSNIPWMVG